MTETPSQGADPRLQTAIENSGIMDGAEDTSEGTEGTITPQNEPEGDDSHNDEPDEGEGGDDDQKGTTQGEGEQQSRKTRSAPSSPIKALFAQQKETAKAIGDLAAIVAKMATKPEVAPTTVQTEKQEEVTDEVREFAKIIAEKQGLDPDALSELVKGIVQLTSKERATLPQDVQDKLKIVDSLQAEEAKRQEIAAQQNLSAEFDVEWNGFESQLRKQYPNASSSELKQAKELMVQIAHSDKGGVVVDEKKRIIKGYPLDYIFFKDVEGIKKKFDTILKVAPKSRSTEESGGKGINDDIPEDGGEINLDPENMTPARFKQHQKQQVERGANDSRGVQMMG